jgi:hypothetical protein
VRLVQTPLAGYEGSATGRRCCGPTDQQIPPAFGTASYLDVNNDGINDFSFVNLYSATSSNLDLWVSPVVASNEIFSAVPAACRVSSLLRMRHSDAVDARMQLIEHVPLSVPRCGIW